VEYLDADLPVLEPVDLELGDPGLLDERARRRLLGRYAADAPALVAAALPGELESIPGTQTLWAELRWAARAEGVVHLDDLLLRRVRLGHLLPCGGEALLPRIRALCQPELAWDDPRWESEQAAYLDLWGAAYGLPPTAAVPDWRGRLAQARTEWQAAEPRRRRRRRIIAGSGLTTAALALAALGGLWLWLRRRAR
jgi:glycerol-3-phosphate dehydrogenase